MLGTLAVQAKAQGYGVNGLFMGAGGGALIGQAIGRDTEATLIGTAVGGTLGNMIDNEMDRDANAMNYGLAQPVTVFHPVRYPVFRHGKICRDFIVVERRHGYSREVVVKTVCRDRHLNHFRGDYRHHFRDDYRHHFRGDRYHFRDNHRHHWKGNRHDRW
jgi:hypothetical protein